MKTVLLITLLLYSTVFGASLLPYDIDIVDQQGTIVADANFRVTVYDAGTMTVSDIFVTDANVPKTNPITPASDARSAVGKLRFYGPLRSYDVVVASSVYPASITARGVGPTQRRIVYPKGDPAGRVIARTATVDGLGTGLIAPNATFVSATSADANNMITLPPIVVGAQITIQAGSVGCEIVCTGSGDMINNIVCGATNELALPAYTTFYCIATTATKWVVVGWTDHGEALSPLIPDAR